MENLSQVFSFELDYSGQKKLKKTTTMWRQTRDQEGPREEKKASQVHMHTYAQFQTLKAPTCAQKN